MGDGRCICSISRHRRPHEPGPHHVERCPLYEPPAEDVCPDCLDPMCDGYCQDALLNEFGVEPNELDW